MVEAEAAENTGTDSEPHHAVVFVHGVGDGMKQGDFLAGVLEPTLDYMAEAGATFEKRESVNLRRGPRPAQFDVSANVPAVDDGGQPAGDTRVNWRFYEAMWNDEHREPSEVRALLWWFRAFPMFVVDHLSYYDPSWRFQIWNSSAWKKAEGDHRAFRYHYDVRWPLGKKFLFCLAFGLLLPLLVLVVAGLFVLLATVVWLALLLGRLAFADLPMPALLTKSVPAYWNLGYRMLLTIAWLPLLAVGAALLLVLLLLAIIPVKIPKIEEATKAVVSFVQLRFGDILVYNRDLVPSGAISGVVQEVLATALEAQPAPASLTVVAHSQGCVVSYEALAALPEGTRGITFITAGSMLNRTFGWPWEWGWRERDAGQRLCEPGRNLIQGSLPADTRWVDVFALHDPAPMGSTDKNLVSASEANVFDAPSKNTMTHISAHTTYWDNPVEVISVVADELLYRSRDGWVPGGSKGEITSWQNPNGETGFEWVRAEERGVTPRALRGLHTLRQSFVAMVRAAAYVVVAAVLVGIFSAPGWLDLIVEQVEAIPAGSLPPQVVDALAAAVIALVVIELFDALVRAVLAWRPLRVFLAARYWLPPPSAPGADLAPEVVPA